MLSLPKGVISPSSILDEWEVRRTQHDRSILATGRQPELSVCISKNIQAYKTAL